MWEHTRIFHHETTQYKHVKAGHKTPQRIHLLHVSRPAVFSQAARKLLLQLPPSENSLIHKTLRKQMQKHNTKPSQTPFANTPLFRPTTGALPSVDQGHQHNVITMKSKAGTNNRTANGILEYLWHRLICGVWCRHQTAVGAVVTNVQMRNW